MFNSWGIFYRFKFGVGSLRSRCSSDYFDDCGGFGSEFLVIGWFIVSILMDFKDGMCYSNMIYVGNGVIVDVEVEFLFIVVGYF